MGLKNGAFCTVWRLNNGDNKMVDLKEKYCDIMISINKKNSQGNFEKDFSGKLRCLGNALKVIKGLSLSEKDRLKLLEIEVSNKYDKNTRKTYTNYICWDLEPAEIAKKNDNSVEILNDEPVSPFNITDDVLPF